MTHKRESLVAAIVTQIANAATAVGSKVYRGRRLVVEEVELPLALVYQNNEASRINDFGQDRKWRALEVAVEIHQKSDPADINDPAIETALNAVAEGIEDALEADYTFGGNALKFEHVASETIIETGEVDRGVLRLVLEVEYLTARTAAGS